MKFTFLLLLLFLILLVVYKLNKIEFYDEICNNRGYAQYYKQYFNNSVSTQFYKCDCVYPGWTGNYCEINNIECDPQGGYIVDGKCECKIDPETGKKWLGDKCQYSDTTTCNRRGIVDNNGICQCNIDPATKKKWKGDRCQYSNITTCNGRGLVDNNGICQCSYGWSGKSCNILNTNIPTLSPKKICPNGKNGYNCQYDDLICNGNGKVDYNGICQCNIDPETGKKWLGNRCQYSDTTTCNGNGTVDNNGNCTCDPAKGKSGIFCNSSCPIGYLGDKCQYSDLTTCNGNGKVDNNGVCVCNNGYNGPNCQYDDLVCNNNGQVDYFGNCKCNIDNISLKKWLGDKCQYSDITTCNGNGTVDNNGNCTCNVGWKGLTCAEGKTHFIGNKHNYFENNTIFKSNDDKIKLHFISPGILIITHKLYKQSSSIIENDILYCGYEIKDKINTELFFSNQQNDTNHSLLTLEINIPTNRPTTPTSRYNEDMITELSVKLCHKIQLNCINYTVYLQS